MENKQIKCFKVQEVYNCRKESMQMVYLGI